MNLNPQEHNAVFFLKSTTALHSELSIPFVRNSVKLFSFSDLTDYDGKGGDHVRYRLSAKLKTCPQEKGHSETECYAEILSREEFEKNYPEFSADRALLRSLEHPHYCKAELLPNCAAGTLLLPQKAGLSGEGTALAFILDRHRLIFLDDSGTAGQFLEGFSAVNIPKDSGSAWLFFEFLESLIREDALFLQRYEKRLDGLEELLLESDGKDFGSKLHFYRRGLLRLGSYYSQLTDLADSLADNRNGLFSAKECRNFELFSDRVSRLSSHIRALREYSLQLQEIYQSKIDVRQNKIMQFLTVVTTLFMPLTLIAGWYGMNFSDMPELHAPYAYPIVIAISIAVTVIEIIYFKKKNWFH